MFTELEKATDKLIFVVFKTEASMMDFFNAITDAIHNGELSDVFNERTNNLLKRDKSYYLDTYVDGVRAMMRAISTAPTVDTEDMIHCRDCRHPYDAWEEDSGRKHYMCYRCNGNGPAGSHTGSDYCSYADRR